MAKNLQISYLLDFYGNMLTDKQREIAEQYFDADLSLSEIAENFGITRQGARDAIKRSEMLMLEMEEKIGYAARFRKVEEQLDRIETLTNAAKFDITGAYADVSDLNHQLDGILRVLAELKKDEE